MVSIDLLNVGIFEVHHVKSLFALQSSVMQLDLVNMLLSTLKCM